MKTTAVLSIWSIFSILIVSAHAGPLDPRAAGLEHKGEEQSTARKASKTLPPFVENKGQIRDPSVRFYITSTGRTVFMTNQGVVMDLYAESFEGDPHDREAGLKRRKKQGVVINTRFVGGTCAALRGEKELPGKFNYFVGEKSHWRTSIPTFQETVYEGLYEGIDLRYISRLDKLKYQFEIAAGSDPEVIKIQLSGIEGLNLDRDGNLVVRTQRGHYLDEKPFVYQVVDGKKVEIRSAFKIMNDSTFGFSIGAYDTDSDLIIDPGFFLPDGLDRHRCQRR